MRRTAPYGSAIRILKKHDAPEEVINCFRELYDINNGLEPGLKSPVGDILLDACKVAGFAAIYSSQGKARHIRARLMDRSHVSYADDCAPDPTSADAPAREQAYRRGYSQGFHEARRMLQRGETTMAIIRRESEINAWRTAPIQTVGSYPGSTEEQPKLKLVSRGISPGLRYEILKRDKFRCRLCGHGAAEGVALEIDHRISLFAGGTNEQGNLWTLCADCNRGKSSDSL